MTSRSETATHTHMQRFGEGPGSAAAHGRGVGSQHGFRRSPPMPGARAVPARCRRESDSPSKARATSPPVNRVTNYRRSGGRRRQVFAVIDLDRSGRGDHRLCRGAVCCHLDLRTSREPTRLDQVDDPDEMAIQRCTSAGCGRSCRQRLRACSLSYGLQKASSRSVSAAASCDHP
jgi:hypothetical protein